MSVFSGFIKKISKVRQGSMLIKEKNIFFLYIHISINSEILSITFKIITVYSMDIGFQGN